mmetsp:Transcript_19965/g.46835  ORF Transcript_19965/g.46835 Transcript_19965/m.46835 type:complete len:299 (-) Transcript_19965:28-924(-)
MSVPRTTSGRLCGSKAAGSSKRPRLAPRTIAPVSAPTPPTTCTIQLPAKSVKPTSRVAESQPPPQVHATTPGYIMLDMKNAKPAYVKLRTLSATPPLTMVTAVVQKTHWKNHCIKLLWQDSPEQLSTGRMCPSAIVKRLELAKPVVPKRSYFRSPYANAHPQSHHPKVPTHTLSKFFMRRLDAFLARQVPVSNMANPPCIRAAMLAHIQSQMVSRALAMLTSRSRKASTSAKKNDEDKDVCSPRCSEVDRSSNLRKRASTSSRNTYTSLRNSMQSPVHSARQPTTQPTSTQPKSTIRI